MKTISITLTQEPDGSLFRVVSFRNTMELSVGQTIPRKTLSEWVTRPHISLSVTGLTAIETDCEGLLERSDVLEMQQ